MNSVPADFSSNDNGGNLTSQDSHSDIVVPPGNNGSMYLAQSRPVNVAQVVYPSVMYPSYWGGVPNVYLQNAPSYYYPQNGPSYYYLQNTPSYYYLQNGPSYYYLQNSPSYYGNRFDWVYPNYLPRPSYSGTYFQASQTNEVANSTLYSSNNPESTSRRPRFTSTPCSTQFPKSKKHYFCQFCFRNKKTERIYSSHMVKNENGVVTCGFLRAYVCGICGATGDTAHTRKYCPLITYEELTQILNNIN